MDSLFETCTRNKVRFESSRGLLTVEDLWDLPLTSKKDGFDLDTLAKSINRELKQSEEESFVIPNTATNSILQLKLEVLKFIIKVKLDDAEARKSLQEKQERRKKLIDALERKEDQALLNMSAEDIRKELEKV